MLQFAFKITLVFLCLLNTFGDCRSFEAEAALSSNESLRYSRKSQLRRQILRDTPIRVPAYESPPLLYAKFDPSTGNFTHKGFLVDVLEWILHTSQTKVDYVFVDEWVASEIGILQYITDQLMRKEIDVALYPIPIRWEALQFMEFSVPVELDEFYLMQKLPEEQTRLSAITRPFSTPVWIFSILSTIMTVLLMSAVTFCHNSWRAKVKNKDEHKTMAHPSISKHLNHHLEYVLSVITNQGNYIAHRASNSFLIAVGSWSLMMTVLVSAYTGDLKSWLIWPNFMPIINSLDDLVDRDIQITININSPLANSILNATSGTNKQLGDVLRKNPKLLVKSPMDAVANIFNYKCVYAANENMIKYMITRNFEDNDKKCKLTISKQLDYTESYALGMDKGGLFNDLLNKELSYLWQSGVLSRLKGMYFRSSSEAAKCLQSSVGFEKFKGLRPVPLKLVDLSSPFLLLGVGLSVSILALLWELMLATLMKMKKFLAKKIASKVTPFVHSHLMPAAAVLTDASLMADRANNLIENDKGRNCIENVPITHLEVPRNNQSENNECVQIK